MFDEKIQQIKEQIEAYKENSLKIFSTSSFQTNSVILLHIISWIDYQIPIYFLNTGYHFPETLLFKSDLKKRLGLNVIDLFPSVPKNQQRDSNGMLMYASDPDYCCYMNKVQPLEPIKQEYDIWMSGIRGDQNENRHKKGFEEREEGLIRYHPIIDWTSKMVYQYLDHYELPRHPLEGEGYLSIGCQPCTQKYLDKENGRLGRWKGLIKSECGLHK
ncbi:MAG: phosphoadenylyl-sulfate reductase [Cyclobacteriaceae bacterium]